MDHEDIPPDNQQLHILCSKVVFVFLWCVVCVFFLHQYGQESGEEEPSENFKMDYFSQERLDEIRVVENRMNRSNRFFTNMRRHIRNQVHVQHLVNSGHVIKQSVTVGTQTEDSDTSADNSSISSPADDQEKQADMPIVTSDKSCQATGITFKEQDTQQELSGLILTETSPNAHFEQPSENNGRITDLNMASVSGTNDDGSSATSANRLQHNTSNPMNILQPMDVPETTKLHVNSQNMKETGVEALENQSKSTAKPGIKCTDSTHTNATKVSQLKDPDASNDRVTERSLSPSNSLSSLVPGVLSCDEKENDGLVLPRAHSEQSSETNDRITDLNMTSVSDTNDDGSSATSANRLQHNTSDPINTFHPIDVPETTKPHINSHNRNETDDEALENQSKSTAKPEMKCTDPFHTDATKVSQLIDPDPSSDQVTERSLSPSNSLSSLVPGILSCEEKENKNSNDNATVTDDLSIRTKHREVAVNATNGLEDKPGSKLTEDPVIKTNSQIRLCSKVLTSDGSRNLLLPKSTEKHCLTGSKTEITPSEVQRLEKHQMSKLNSSLAHHHKKSKTEDQAKNPTCFSTCKNEKGFYPTGSMFFKNGSEHPLNQTDKMENDGKANDRFLKSEDDDNSKTETEDSFLDDANGFSTNCFNEKNINHEEENSKQKEGLEDNKHDLDVMSETWSDPHEENSRHDKQPHNRDDYDEQENHICNSEEENINDTKDGRNQTQSPGKHCDKKNDCKSSEMAKGRRHPDDNKLENHHSPHEVLGNVSGMKEAINHTSSQEHRDDDSTTPGHFTNHEPRLDESNSHHLDDQHKEMGDNSSDRKHNSNEKGKNSPSL